MSGHILIVDDDTATIRALGALLEDAHEVRFATSGARALELIAADPPELVLLDVVMPGIDGYAVCRHLKADPATADLPVIFITALASPEEEARGLETGAVDYVTKPFSPAIVRARVATHLTLRRAGAALRDQNRHLETLVEERTRKLAAAEREKMAALRRLVAGVAHEINTPLGVALGCASHLGDRVAALARQAAGNGLRRADLDRFVESAGELAGLLSANLVRTGDLVRLFMELGADRRGRRRAFALAPFLEEWAAGPEAAVATAAGHRLAVSCPGGLTAEGEPAVLAAVLERLVRNAAEHAFPAGTAGRITLSAAPDGPDGMVLRVTDDGAGIPPDLTERVWEPFFTTRRAAGSIGLGLAIVHNLVTDRLGGTVAAEPAPGGGTVVTLRLPLCQPAPP
ncbi:hybrid sensor histidine kinase/response regulator [Azospirillum halopraeferens]|uniref:hybrid sensor histidine kinase/response regulator n=1 Tax=Azospirillum halopraeferens TaxID=34010 RepID=UPI0003FFC472|nr:hybrid sensor histidine kinase/response regulator [Azospirillum halopraeferens]